MGCWESKTENNIHNATEARAALYGISERPMINDTHANDG